MSGLELSVATMRWYRAYLYRRAAHRELRDAKPDGSERPAFWTAESKRLAEAEKAATAARKAELRARRQLLEACQHASPPEREPPCIDV